ncbi:hypothetical protein N9N66_04110 [Schleiferiaceae bacterium]|nr:hypothetical protein [Schleiferiaceae bacterium]
MKAKLIIITVLALCSFTVSAQEFIAPYNMMRSTQANVDIIDTVPADEVWKVESFGFNPNYVGYARYYHNYLPIELIRGNSIRSPKLPFWLDSGEVIILPYRIALQPNSSSNPNDLQVISILRFKKPD